MYVFRNVRTLKGEKEGIGKKEKKKKKCEEKERTSAKCSPSIGYDAKAKVFQMSV